MSWPVKPLGQICGIVAGQSPPSETYNKNRDGMPFFQGKADFGELFPTVRTWCSKPNKVAEPNDILISVRAPVGATNICNVTACIGRGLAAIKPSEKVVQKYLLYYFRYFEPILSASGNGAIFSAITMSDLKEVQIPLPPLEVQKKIAAVLEKADELRLKREEQIKRLDDLLQATFLDMFGDPVTNPKGWPVKKLSDLGKLDRGKSKHRPRNAPELLGGAHPLIQTGDVANSDCYITEYNSTYSDIGLAQSKMWKAGILCITIAANIAKTAILGIDACFPDSVVGFIPNKETNVEFIHTWFCFFQQILENNAPESAQKNINLAILRDLEVIMPPLNWQNKFKCVFKSIQKDLKSKQKDDLILSKSLFNSLMQRAFKGELELR